jgi:AbrB family looped-hinge helix DNA binding protein
MKTTLSSKGQVVLPATVRRKLGLLPGASLEIALEAERIVLEPIRPRPSRPVFGIERRTGLPVLKASPRAMPLSSGQVKELLADFP